MQGGGTSDRDGDGDEDGDGDVDVDDGDGDGDGDGVRDGDGWDVCGDLPSSAKLRWLALIGLCESSFSNASHDSLCAASLSISRWFRKPSSPTNGSQTSYPA